MIPCVVHLHIAPRPHCHKNTQIWQSYYLRMEYLQLCILELAENKLDKSQEIETITIIACRCTSLNRYKKSRFLPVYVMIKISRGSVVWFVWWFWNDNVTLSNCEVFNSSQSSAVEGHDCEVEPCTAVVGGGWLKQRLSVDSIDMGMRSKWRNWPCVGVRIVLQNCEIVPLLLSFVWERISWLNDGERMTPSWSLPIWWVRFPSQSCITLDSANDGNKMSIKYIQLLVMSKHNFWNYWNEIWIPLVPVDFIVHYQMRRELIILCFLNDSNNSFHFKLRLFIHLSWLLWIGYNFPLGTNQHKVISIPFLTMIYTIHLLWLFLSIFHFHRIYTFRGCLWLQGTFNRSCGP